MIEVKGLNGRSRGGFMKALGHLVQGPKGIEPRKGQGEQPLARLQTGAYRRQHQDRRMVIPISAIVNLVARDDIIWAIRRTIRMAIGDMDWAIIPDLDHIKADLKRWATITKLNLDMPGFDVDFQPLSIRADWFEKYTGVLRDLIRDEEDAGVRLATSPRIQGFFKNCLVHHEVEAEKHIAFVKHAFEKPNPSAESSFRILLDQIIDSLLLFDQAALIKNPTYEGTLGELYTIPGQHVRIYRNADRSTPQPPSVSYDWYEGQQTKAIYNNSELVFMMANPQESGYGKSPIEFLVEQIVTTIYGDAYLLEWFQNNNIPPAVFDLGPFVDQEERDAMEEMWDERVMKGRHRVVFVSNKESVKGWMAMPNVQSNKDAQIIESFKLQANRKCAAFGMSLNDIGFTEDLHRTTADTQMKLTQSRGVVSLAKVVAAYLNGEVVKGNLWMRDRPADPTCLEGRDVPVFPWSDVKFVFKDEDKEQKLEEAQRMILFVDDGIMNRNEIRTEIGLPEIEGGEVYSVKGGAASVKVSDLYELPKPSEQDAKGGQGGEGDGAKGSQLPANNGLPKVPVPAGAPPVPQPPGPKAAAEKAKDELYDFAERLRKLVAPEGE